MKKNKVIKFYHVNKEFGCFSNFAPYPILLDGKLWPTSEHYFQAQKFKGTIYEEEIRLCKTPMCAASMGRNRNKPLRSDWEQVKDNLMEKAVRAKMIQHEDIRHVLLGTVNAEIIEHTANDHYWGDAGDGSGKNMLGKILMKIRDELIEGASISPSAPSENQ